MAELSRKIVVSDPCSALWGILLEKISHFSLFFSFGWMKQEPNLWSSTKCKVQL